MATNYIAPTWRMPENTNQSKLSNYSINFNGSSDRINLGSGIQLSGNKSISAWVYVQPGVDQKVILGAAFPVYYFWLNNALSKVYIRDASGGPTQLDTGTLSEGWTHFCITGDATTATLYINGTSTDTGTDRELDIQNIGAAPAYYFDGKIAEITIFDYILSTDQITYLYNLNNPMAITGAKPIAYYPIGDNSNPTALAGYPNISVGDSVFDFPVRANPAAQTMSVSNSGVTAFNNATNFSFSGWFYIDGNLSQSILNLKDGANGRFAINYYSPYQGLRCNVNYSDSGVYSSARAVGALVTGRWFHYCAVFDGAGATNADKIILYIDGQAQTLTFNAGTYATSMGTIGATNELEIGKSLSGTFLGFGGDVTNVQMWNVSLSPTEVTTLYNNGSPYKGTQPQASNLQTWYKLDGDGDTFDGTNWTLKDDGLIGADMTSSGMTSANLIQSDLYRQTPYSNYSINFDRAGSDKLSTAGGSSAILSGATSCSISLWFNMASVATGTPGLAPFTTNWINPNYNYIYRWYDGNLLFFLRTLPSSTTSASYSWTPTQDVWYHTVGTYDGSIIRLYLDGIQVATATTSGALPTITSSDEIGFYTAAYYYDGPLSNIAYWKNTVLTKAEIAEIYNAGVPADLSSFSGTAPNAWYPLDGKNTYYNGSTLVARDAIGTNDMTGVNLVQENIVGNAPGSDSNGTGVNLDITDLKGDMSGSTKNSYSLNMADYGDPNSQGVTPANSGRTTSVPG